MSYDDAHNELMEALVDPERLDSGEADDLIGAFEEEVVQAERGRLLANYDRLKDRLTIDQRSAAAAVLFTTSDQPDAEHMERYRRLAERLLTEDAPTTALGSLREGVAIVRRIETLNPPYAGVVVNDPDAGL